MTIAAASSSFRKVDDSILFLGRTVSGEELWSTTGMVTTHMFVSGTTGSGKTEFLTSLMVNAMAWGSGAVFIDGKGDIGFPAKLHAAATAIGREEDLLILNFMKGNVAGHEGISSHTVNPFAILSSDEICQIMATMIPRDQNESFWPERAISLMNCIVNTLTWLRDNHKEPMTASSIRGCLTFNSFVRLRDRVSGIEGFPAGILAEVDIYLNTLAGYIPSKTVSQVSTVYEQHGYCSMQWTRVVGVLCSTYGHILDVEVPDIDFRDVILNRRTLVVLLPSLERSSSDIANIGALIVGMIKSMLGQALRSPVEGSWSDVVKNRITNARYPFMIIMDEVGQYLADGMGMLAQQARSLNIGLVFATQDFDSLYSRNPRETQAILANTSTKIFMKAENSLSLHLSMALSPYVGLIRSRKNSLAEMNAAEKELIRARLVHRIPTDAGEAALKARLDALNLEAVQQATSGADKDLASLLKGFTSGQMLVSHGTDCIEGRASYIALDSDIDGHCIQLRRFATISDYGQVVLNTRDAEARSAKVVEGLRSQLEIAAKNISRPFPPMKAVATDINHVFPPSIFDVTSVNRVWVQFLAAAVDTDGAFDNPATPFAKLVGTVSARNADVLKIAKRRAASDDRVDFLTGILKEKAS